MLRKFCRLCQTERSLKAFSWKNRERVTKQSYCKLCQNKRSRAHYQSNKNVYLEKTKKRNQKILKEIQNYVWSFLSAHPCIDCGESDIVVLEFDHLSNKVNNLSGLISEKSSLSKVKLEIEKCVVRCANCHRRKTAKDFGWKKSLLAPLAQ